MGGTHSCSRASLPMRWSVDGRHPLLRTCLSAHAPERGMGGTHSCSRASLPMRSSVDGRHPLLLTCLSAHALERGWEAPTLGHVSLCPCARAWMGGTHSCSRASLPMRDGAWMGGTHSCSRVSLPMCWSVDRRHPLLLTCLSAHALERGWEAPTLAHVPLCPWDGAWMGGTHSCSRASLPMRWSVDGRHPLLLTCLSAHAPERGWRHPLLLTCLSAHAMERGWEAPTLAHVPMCPCARAWMGGTHPCSSAWAERHMSKSGCLPSTLQRVGTEAREQEWVPPIHAPAHGQRGT